LEQETAVHHTDKWLTDRNRDETKDNS